MQKEILNRIHYNHLGVKKCTQLAQESLFWPLMAHHIRNKIGNCSLCLQYSNSQQKEPLKNHEIPFLPWNKVGCDIFEIKGQKYLLLVDYYSKFVDVQCLNHSPTSSKIISVLKDRFSLFGIPLTLISDGGPQFASAEFSKFAKQWQFKHIFSSPMYAQSNGMAERHIQTIKKMFKKVLAEKKDLYLALLQYKNAPIAGNVSPSELFFCRKLRTTIPCTTNYLKQKLVKNYNKTIKTAQTYQKTYYDKSSTNDLPAVLKGTRVYVQVIPKGTWSPGTVVEVLANKKYRVLLESGSVLVRNRRFIKPLKTDKAKVTGSDTPSEQCNTPKRFYIENNDVCLSNNNHPRSPILEEKPNIKVTEEDIVNRHTVTLSGRISKPPHRLQFE